jgi:hypothetical protein
MVGVCQAGRGDGRRTSSPAPSVQGQVPGAKEVYIYIPLSGSHCILQCRRDEPLVGNRHSRSQGFQLWPFCVPSSVPKLSAHLTAKCLALGGCVNAISANQLISENALRKVHKYLPRRSRRADERTRTADLLITSEIRQIRLGQQGTLNCITKRLTKQAYF